MTYWRWDWGAVAPLAPTPIPTCSHPCSPRNLLVSTAVGWKKYSIGLPSEGQLYQRPYFKKYQGMLRLLRCRRLSLKPDSPSSDLLYDLEFDLNESLLVSFMQKMRWSVAGPIVMHTSSTAHLSLINCL